MGWDSYNSRAPKLNDLIALKALNITVKQAVSEINFPGKNFVLCGHRTKICTPSAKKILKNYTRFGTRSAVNLLSY
jgi:hypothetical protein